MRQSHPSLNYFKATNILFPDFTAISTPSMNPFTKCILFHVSRHLLLSHTHGSIHEKHIDEEFELKSVVFFLNSISSLFGTATSADSNFCESGSLAFLTTSHKIHKKKSKKPRLQKTFENQVQPCPGISWNAGSKNPTNTQPSSANSG